MTIISDNNLSLANFSADNQNETATGPGCGLVGAAECRVFWVVCNAILLLSFCVIGLVGNTLSIVILRRDKGNKVASLLLQALAVADNSFLATAAICVGVIWGIVPSSPRTLHLTQHAMPYISKFLNPVGATMQMCIAWMTVLLAVNRYVAICHPLKSLWFCTKKKTWIYIIFIFSFSVVFNIPRFFQLKVVRVDNMVCAEDTAIGMGTLFGDIHTKWIYSVLVLFVPFTVLLIVNTLVIRRYRSRIRMHRTSIVSTAGRESRVWEDGVTLTMVAIVVVFLVCNAPDHLHTILQLSGAASSHAGPCYYFLTIANLLSVVSSCTNFFIYYLCHHTFRKSLLEILCCASVKEDKYSKSLEGFRKSKMESAVLMNDR